MYIEDMIDRLASNGRYLFELPLQLWPRDNQIVASFSNQINRGSALTEKQATMAIGFCQKYKKQLEEVLKVDLTLALSTPQFKNPFRVLDQFTKQVSLVTENPKKIKLTFRYDENLVKLLKDWKNKSQGNTAEWNNDEKAWFMNLTEGNILFVHKELIPRGFNVDPEIMEFSEKIGEILEDFENHVPMVISADGKFSYKNVHPSVPQPESQILLDVLFNARQYGIVTWDDEVEKSINSEILPLTRQFLNNPLGNSLSVNSNDVPLEQFCDILRYARDVLIIVPAVNELSYLKNWINFLFSEGFSPNDISVLFRLENSNNKEFNEFVKSQGLNLPLSSQTRIFFVSQKLPKPLIKNHQSFGAVINLGSGHAPHYSIQNILSDHHNIITYNKKN